MNTLHTQCAEDLSFPEAEADIMPKVLTWTMLQHGHTE